VLATLISPFTVTAGEQAITRSVDFHNYIYTIILNGLGVVLQGQGCDVSNFLIFIQKPCHLARSVIGFFAFRKKERYRMATEKSIIRKPKNKENPYVMIAKAVFEDERLSWKAKGLLGYLLSRPDDWQIIVKDLIKRSKDGRESVLSGLKELIKYGYLRREQERGERGRFGSVVYEIYEEPLEEEEPQSENPITVDSPQSDFPYTVKPEADKPDTENPHLLNNELTNKRHELKNENNNNDTPLRKQKSSAIESTESETVVVVDQSDEIKKLLQENDIPFNDEIITDWRKIADDQTIISAIQETLKKPDIDTFIGYIYGILRKGFVPNKGTDKKPKKVKSEYLAKLRASGAR
jgi:DNA-binding transcriptional regulator GbsR (MarR family)